MYEVLLALGVGIVVGLIFSFLKLPLPAPPALAAVMGVAGIYFGGEIFKWIAEHWMTK
jgi:XapX domain-containing protein